MLSGVALATPGSSRSPDNPLRPTPQGFNETMKTKTLASVALMALVLAAMTIGATGARFTDSATSTANTFTTGKLDLKLTDSNETSLDAVSASITATALRPGDFVVAPLTIVNPASPASTLNLRYAMTSTSTSSCSQ